MPDLKPPTCNNTREIPKEVERATECLTSLNKSGEKGNLLLCPMVSLIEKGDHFAALR